MSKYKAGVIVILSIVFLVVTFSKIRNTGSDPEGTLLVAESILTHKTIKLDHYGEEILATYGYKVHKKNNHFYYYFPLGTSIVSIPFVAVAKGFGLDMVRSEAVVQIAITALTSILTVFFLIKIARLFLNPTNALVIAAVFWFGTSFASTTGTALWSHNFATLFALLAIYAVINASRFDYSQLWPAISIALFVAYLCRPTMALLSPFVLLYFFMYFRFEAIKAGALLLVLLALFIGLSMHEFGQVLPDYYLTTRLSGGHLKEALYGNLFSPARGLFVYSPFIAFVWLCLKFSKKDWALKRSWLLIGLAWPVTHLIVISRFPHWYGGYSYGSRFLTDILPGIFLLTLYSWPTSIKGVGAKASAGFLGLASIFAIVVNSGQGLFNGYTAAWNADPDIDKNPKYLFDWGYPQFLANRNGHEKRLFRHNLSTIKKN